jgi:hydrogenase maturation protein HypF
MLPYTPLHHLLLAELGFPVVATSGNRSGEPICIDETQALQTLAGIADVFLVHNRPIARPVDDSIVQIINGQPSLLRRARGGYAPMPISLFESKKAIKPCSSRLDPCVLLSTHTAPDILGLRLAHV